MFKSTRNSWRTCLSIQQRRSRLSQTRTLKNENSAWTSFTRKWSRSPPSTRIPKSRADFKATSNVVSFVKILLERLNRGWLRVCALKCELFFHTTSQNEKKVGEKGGQKSFEKNSAQKTARSHLIQRWELTERCQFRLWALLYINRHLIICFFFISPPKIIKWKHAK